MINRFLQFLKKQQLAVNLARNDLLFLIENLQSFKLEVPFAKLFYQKQKTSKLKRISNFLERENNPLLYVLAKELSVLDDKLFYLPNLKKILLNECVLFKTTSGIKDADFYVNLFIELVNNDFPMLDGDINHLYTNFDMRLYASDLENLSDLLNENERCCQMEIDWIKTSKTNLYLCFDSKCKFTQKLNPSAQENLSRLFAFMLLEKSVFVSYWNGVMLNPKNEVGFLDFDAVYSADSSLLKYALSYIKQKTPAKTLLEFKLQRALKLLEYYCPDIDCFSFWKSSVITACSNKTDYSNPDMLNKLSENGFDFGTRQKITHTNPKDFEYLLDVSRHRKDPQFRKSTIYYWGPLLVLIYLLFKYF